MHYVFILFVDVMDDIYKNDEYWNIGLSEDVYKTIMKNKDRLNSAINYDNDYILDYFGFKVICHVFYVIVINNSQVCCFSEFNAAFFS